MAAETIPYKVLQNAATDPNRPAYHQKVDGKWQMSTWLKYGGEVRQAAKALISLGIEPGAVVTIVGFNRPEWLIMDVAAMAVGGVPAGIYTTNSPTEVAYILNHSESPVLLIEDESQWHKIVAVRDELTHLRKVVAMADCGPIGDEMVIAWADFMALGADMDDSAVDDRINALSLDDLGTLIYTSGTTGPPKGVMLSHDNLAWTAQQALDIFDIGPDDSVVSYLPLSHIAEQDFTVHAPATARSQVYFAESIDNLLPNMVEVQPTLFFAVPRVWEKMQTGLAAKLGEATGAKAKLAGWARNVGSKVVASRNKGIEPSGALAVQYKLADKLVFSKVKAALGLSNAKACIVGAAPIAKEVLEFFASLDITIWEVYGQSEDTGPTSFNVPGKTRFGSVGPAYPGVSIKIAEDGEIVVQGRNVFLGYYKDEEATAETLKDGWLYSGDLGTIDDQGFLDITGRKKDILITAGGKNVAPKPMESGLKNHPLVSEAVVIGDRRKFLTALVCLDEEAVATYMETHHLHGPAHEVDEIHESIQQAVDALNQNLARVEQIKKFAILPRMLSIEEGELTPTLKVKRNKVNDHFADVIDAMYADA